MSTNQNGFQHPLGVQDFSLFSSQSGDSASALLDDYSTYLTGFSSESNYEYQPSAPSLTRYPTFEDSSSHEEQKFYSPVSPQDIDECFGGNGDQLMSSDGEHKFSQSSMNSDEFDRLYDLPSLPKDIELHTESTRASFPTHEVAVKIEAESQSDPYAAPGASFLDYNNTKSFSA
jgi:hypothetical protein